MQRNQRYFAAKHRAYLAQCHPHSDGAVEAARLRLCARPRILFIEDELPDAQLGMGFVRSACAPKGAFTLWVQVPPGQWSVGPVAGRRLGWVTGWV